MRSITLCFAILLFYGCAPIQIKVDYDQNINFDKYKSYAWIANEQPDIVDISFEKTLLDNLVMDTTDKVLKDRGYARNNNPDFLITYYLVVNTKTDVYLVENYYSNIGYPTQPTTSSTRDYEKLRKSTYEQGMLILDIVDNQTKERIWRGYAQSRIGIYNEREKQEKRIRTAIKKILNEFPP
ncbi:DUF4136 domain-containing protein [Kaarinaea lacus]